MQIQELTKTKDEDVEDITYLTEQEKPESSSEENESSSEESLEIPEDFYSNFLKDVESLASSTIESYFQGKEMHIGGPIPQSFLRNPDYITMILNTDISIGADRAYKSIENSGRYSDSVDAVGEDIKLVVGLLHSIGRVVPRAFVSGILLMHLELIEGLDI